ncbi:hypothetical protein LOZ54_003342 [Ophidiomyces ophidiicola]|nr:hypothetical protein LOZ54_003342 [Ophidiomyces ophidiicola]
MAWSTSSLVVATCCVVLLFANPTAAFGAGNIASLSKIEGQNWRHGDIEDVLLSLVIARVAGGKKFSKLDVKRVYFGNWLRDYSQAVDVGTVKYVSAEAIRILLWVLGFLSFGYGTAEFEVTTDRLGCYQPTEHIDNPLGYAEGDDARRYDKRLRGPVDARRELSIDPRSGLKNYIASEDAGIATSAGLLRNVFRRCIELGRSYGRSRDKNEFYEALRLLGTGLHCLEDFSAHSNYTELSLIELGEQDIFPHVGRRTTIQLQGANRPVYPIVTGTFGGVDFLHSVMGEFSDKATQSELQSLEGVMEQSQGQGGRKSFIQELLNKIPSDILGGQNNAAKMDEFQANAQQQQQAANISPKKPEEWTRYLDDVRRQIYPILEWHDNLIKTISEAIDKIPLIGELIEQIQNEINLFVFSVIAPYVMPIISQVKRELETGSSEVIQSSRAQQHNIFNDDNSTDPTHSMLSKDHFSNLLNEPAGKVAQTVVRWAVPQIMEAWDNENTDIDRTLTRIIHGVFHHPAHRGYGEDGQADIRRDMFAAVEKWWRDQGRGQDSLRNQLSREGVRKGDNHKPGVHDTGHGCGKPLALPKGKSGSSGGGGGGGRSNDTDQLAKAAKAAVGGGILGDLVGGIVGSAGTEVLAGSSGYDGGRHTAQEYKKENKAQEYGGNYGDHGYKQKEKYGGSYGGDYEDDKKNKKKSKGYGDDDDDDKKYKKEKKYKGYDDDDDDDEYKKKKKDKKYKDYDDDDDKKKSKHEKKRSEEYGRSEYGQSGHGGGSYGRQQEHSQSAYREDSGYGRQQQSGGYGGASYGREQEHSQSTYRDDSGYGRQQLSGGYGGDSYGQQQGYSESTRRDDSGYGRHQQSGGYGGASYGREQEHSQSTYRDDSGYGRHEQSGGYGGGQHQSGYGQERQTGGYGGGQGGYSSGYGQETRQQHGGYESQGRRRSKSRERESGRYESSAYGGRNEGRYGSEEREFGSQQSYQRRHDNDRDRSDDEGYDRRRQHHRRD